MLLTIREPSGMAARIGTQMGPFYGLSPDGGGQTGLKMAFRFIMNPRKVNSPGISLCVLRLIIVFQDERREQRYGVAADD